MAIRNRISKCVSTFSASYVNYSWNDSDEFNTMPSHKFLVEIPKTVPIYRGSHLLQVVKLRKFKIVNRNEHTSVSIILRNVIIIENWKPKQKIYYLYFQKICVPKQLNNYTSTCTLHSNPLQDKKVLKKNLPQPHKYFYSLT